MASPLGICGLLSPCQPARPRRRCPGRAHACCSVLLASLSLSNACAGGRGYERLRCSCGDGASGAALDAQLRSLALGDKEQEELAFFNDDGSCQTVVVERNLRAADLCQLLALKNRVAKDINWTIVEHWVELGLERSLEDHEEVLSVHWDMSRDCGHPCEKRFAFRKDFRKYEFFHNPQQFFPVDMVDLGSCEQLGNLQSSDNAAVLQMLLLSDGECPPIFSNVWVREANKVWNKVFLLLKKRRLYISSKIQAVAKLLRCRQGERTGSGRGRRGAAPPSNDQGGDLQVFANLAEYNVYSTLNAKKHFCAPSAFGLLLRPAAAAQEPLRCFACESERARLCWITAMRLAKYGKQLRENYRAFTNKQVESSSPKEYSSYTVPNESVRSRVAMDFTGSVGRIVEDPKEAKAIAVAEGYSWKRRWRPAVRHSSTAAGRSRGLESGVHITQPWFHSGMSRDQAAQLVSRHGTVDGVFLVRESRSSPGSFVLTFKCGSKILHTQIQPVMDPVRETLCYSVDSGVTKFYDLLQLVEFYQLNSGCLPTRLTHYVVLSPSGLLPAEAVSYSSSSF